MRSGIDAEVGVWVAGTDQVVVDGPQIAAVVLQQVSAKIFLGSRSQPPQPLKAQKALGHSSSEAASRRDASGGTVGSS